MLSVRKGRNGPDRGQKKWRELEGPTAKKKSWGRDGVGSHKKRERTREDEERRRTRKRNLWGKIGGKA